MAGEEEHTDIRAHQSFGKVAHGVVHAGLVEIELRAATDQAEAKAAQRGGEIVGIIARILQLASVNIGRIADHQRYALFGQSRCNPKQKRYRCPCWECRDAQSATVMPCRANQLSFSIITIPRPMYWTMCSASEGEACFPSM